MAASSADASMVATRVAIAASALAIDAADLVARLCDVTDGPLHHPMVWTDADVGVLGVSARLPEDALLARRMTVLAAGLGDAAGLVRTAMARSGEVWIERWSDRRATVSRAGVATLADDLAALEAVGASAAAARTAGDLLRDLTGDDAGPRLLRATLRPGVPAAYELGARTGATVIARLLERAQDLAIGDAQQKLLERVHAIFAHDRPVLVRIAIADPARDEPRITVTYGPQALDHALRAITGLATRADAATRFGTLTGSLGSERVAALELGLGPVDPAPLSVALAM